MKALLALMILGICAISSVSSQACQDFPGYKDPQFCPKWWGLGYCTRGSVNNKEWYQKYCSKSCFPCVCSNDCHPTNGTCTALIGSYSCTCVKGYTGNGKTCTEINECTSGTHSCHAKAICTNTDGSHTCKCKPGYLGDGKICNKCNPSRPNQCRANATCTYNSASREHLCTCDSGYSGNGAKACFEINECEKHTDNCHKFADCTNTPGSFICKCRFGYIGNGTHCENGKHHLVCTDNSMTIYLDNRTATPGKNSRITLKDAACRYKKFMPMNKFGLSTDYNGCGTVLEETPDHIKYKNEIVWLTTSNAGTIIRSHVGFPFSCSLPRFANTNVNKVLVPVTKVNGSEDGFGDFTIELKMFTDISYRTPVSSFPLRIDIGSRVFFEASVITFDFNINLLIEKCYVAPTLNKNDANQYLLIEKRCNKQGTPDKPQFHTSRSQHKKRFSFQTFAYTGTDTRTIYVHCQVFMCNKKSTDHRCTSGCGGNTIKRKRRSAEQAYDIGQMEEEGIEGNGAAASAILAQALLRNRRAVQEEYLPSRDHSLSIGPFQAPETPGKKDSGFNIIHGMGIGIGGIGLILVAVLAFFLVRRKMKRSENAPETQMKEIPKVNKGYEPEV